MGAGREQVLELLRELNIPYQMVAHAAVYTIDEMERLHLPQAEWVAKNLFLRDDKKRNYYLLSLREEKRVDLKALRTTLGSRPLTFASEGDLEAILGLKKGAVTPFGVLNDEARRVQVLLDRDFQGRQMGVHPNENTATVWLATEDLLRVIRCHGNDVTFLEL